MVICLERGADLHMAQLMPLPLTVSCFSKVQIGLPFWYRFTRVVPDKGPLKGCMYVCMYLWLIKVCSMYIITCGTIQCIIYLDMSVSCAL